MFLGIDCGTQGTKALLVEADGTVRGRGYARHELIERSSGAREQQPRWWVDALRAAVAEALAASAAAPPARAGGPGVPAVDPASTKGAEVEAIGVSGQQHGLVVLDEHLEVIRPAKLWNDTETAPENAELVAKLGGRESCLARFGIVPLTGYTVSKLLWLARHEPANFRRIRHILLPHEYLNFWLTGQLRAEAGDSSGTGFFDPRTRTWARGVLDAVEELAGTPSGQLFAALPELIGPDQFVGTLRPAVAAELRLPPTCRVSAGGGDNMMGAIGTGNVREGVVTLSLGTSSTVYSYAREPGGAASRAGDPTGSVAPFCSSSGGELPLVCTMNCTNVVTGTAELVGRTVADLDGALERTPPGAGGLVFVPFLNGERTPDLPTARGTLAGISATNWTPDHLLRAAVEGVSFGILNGLDLVLAGRPVSTIQVIGGGARSRGWRQLLADSTGATIQVPAEEESGCLGAAIQAMVASAAAAGSPQSFAEVAGRVVAHNREGTCTPRPELHEPYRRARASYGAELQRVIAPEA